MANDIDLPAIHVDPEVAQAALAGLLPVRKSLPPKLFYDEEGCRLFYRITELPEYYLTRAEREPLERAADHVGRVIAPGASLVEYGASDETKALYLLRAADPVRGRVFTTYVPIDVAGPSLHALRDRLAREVPDVAVRLVQADFTRPVPLPAEIAGAPALGFFPGSTIGNMEPHEAVAFLRRAFLALGRGAQFLLGADMRKSPAILLPAYDDSAGVTAAFNRNILVRLNREAAANFDPLAFAHRAVWNDEASRIEMHLVSRKRQTVRVAGQRIDFAEGESIHTESSYKHAPERVMEMAASAGWRPAETWTDSDRLFAVYLFERD